MPHDTNTIYRNSSYGISIGDIQQFFGNSRNDIGSLISNVTINKWAKYKPVRSAKLGILSDSDRKSVQQGLSTTIYTQTGEPTSSLSFFYALLAGNLPWSYNRPRGLNGGGTGIHEWYRFLDFDGYDKRATALFNPYAIESVMLSYDDSLFIQINGVTRENYELSVSDIQIDSIDLEDWYFGVLLFAPNNNNQYTFAASQKVGSGDLSVQFETMQNWAGRTVKMVPFLSSIPLQQGTAVEGGKYVSFIGQSPVNIEIVGSTSGVFAFPNATWNSTNTSVDYTVEIRNTNGVSRQFDVEIQLMVENPQTGVLDRVDGRSEPGYTVAANTTQTISGSFTGITRGSNRYFLTVSSTGSTTIPLTQVEVEDYMPLVI